MTSSPTIETEADLAAMLERFSGRAEGLHEWEYDDFTSAKNSNPTLEQHRQRILREVDPLLGVGPVEELDGRIAAIIRDLRQDATN
ncbi:MAG TPA: hypothetical protein VGW34_11480 [Allosphingosinicella sp.]|nr:hypothetical protein [Allosphingosinicella sp.]